MHLLTTLSILCSATTSVLTKPYSYSYYVSLPGHYQSLAVNDGAVVYNNVPPLAISPIPDIRQGRVDPAFNPNPGIGRQFPVNPGLQPGTNFGSSGVNPSFNQINPGFNPGFNQNYPGINQINPGFNQNRGLGGRYPILPGGQRGPDYRQGGLNPNFNQYPGFNRRFPNTNEPDYKQERDDPDIEEIPSGEQDPQFNPDRNFPWNQNRPGFGNGRFNPSNIPNGELDPQFNRGANIPEFGNRIQPVIPRRRGISRRTAKPQEIDERDKADKEEVTTEQPCSFCGVNKINARDGIDGLNINPDSESVEPKNVSGTVNPGVIIQDNGATPTNIGVPGYLFNSPFVTYYVVPSV